MVESRRSTDMTEEANPGSADADRDASAISPLPGEAGIPDVAQRARTPLSRKGLLAIGLLMLLLVTGAGVAVNRLSTSMKKADEAKRAGEQPTAASTEPRRLDLPAVRAASAIPPTASAPRIPALIPTP